MKHATYALSLAIASLLLSFTATAGNGGRGEDNGKGKEHEATGQSTAVETLQVLYDQAVALIATLNKEIARSMPARVASSEEMASAWKAETRALEQFRTVIKTQAAAIKTILGDGVVAGTEKAGVLAAIGAMREARGVQMSIQRENQLKSSQGRASGSSSESIRRESLESKWYELDLTAVLVERKL